MEEPARYDGNPHPHHPGCAQLDAVERNHGAIEPELFHSGGLFRGDISKALRRDAAKMDMWRNGISKAFQIGIRVLRDPR
jgi:hypothetical protein